MVAGGIAAIASAVEDGPTEPHGSAVEAFGAFVGYLVDDPRRGRVLLRCLAELLICWLNGDLDVPRERLITHCAAFLMAAADVRP